MNLFQQVMETTFPDFREIDLSLNAELSNNNYK